MFNNLKLGEVILDGVSVSVFSFNKIYKPKTHEDRINSSHGFKKRSVRIIARWNTYKNYEQHAILDFSLNYIALFLPTGTENFQRFLNENILAKYLERKKLGHGIKPYEDNP